jgi:hypothetical protein
MTLKRKSAFISVLLLLAIVIFLLMFKGQPRLSTGLIHRNVRVVLTLKEVEGPDVKTIETRARFAAESMRNGCQYPLEIVRVKVEH